MTNNEQRAIVGLSGVLAIRMLGLFMLLPVLVLYGRYLKHSSPFLIGLALGAYGFTQALFQIPCGMLSDRIGRKPVIILGLVVFALGNLFAASANSIYAVIIGRALQGAGAIAAVIMALVADLTSNEVRTKAMAAIGMSIGMSFMIAMGLGPAISSHFGLRGVFLTNAILAFLALPAVVYWVPQPPKPKNSEAGSFFGQLRQVLSCQDLLRLDFGVFVLHFMLMGFFMILPLSLAHVGIAFAYHGWIYVLTMGFSFLAMLPLMLYAEKHQLIKRTFCAFVILLISAFVLFIGAKPLSIWRLIGVCFLFFMAFNFFEATLPSLVSKISSVSTKGAAMGVYTTCQFLGALSGGVCGGLVMQYWHTMGVGLLCLCVAVLWGCVVVAMVEPSKPRAFV